MSEPRFTQAKDPVTGRFLPGNKGGQKHGVNIFLQTGRLPSVRGKRLLNKYLRALERDLKAAMGGSPTPQEDIMIKQVLKAEGVLRLIEIWLQRVPAISKKGWQRGSLELQPCLSQSYGFFLNVQRQALLALGLERKKIDEALDLGRYIAAKDAEKAGKGSRAGVINGGKARDEGPGSGPSREGDARGGQDE
jgi:hypothetical protein